MAGLDGAVCLGSSVLAQGRCLWYYRDHGALSVLLRLRQLA